PKTDPSVWSLGSFAFNGFQVSTYFATDAAAPSIFHALIQFLRDEPRADRLAVLTNDTRDTTALVLPQPGRVVPLIECAEISSVGLLQLDRDWLARRVLLLRLAIALTLWVGG
ncbi:MAG: hypothetical protein AAFY25_07320, partial [Pseudomonadota bacterium]